MNIIPNFAEDKIYIANEENITCLSSKDNELWKMKEVVEDELEKTNKEIEDFNNQVEFAIGDLNKEIHELE